MQPTPPLCSRLTRRVAAEARLAGQAAQLPKLASILTVVDRVGGG